MVHHNLGMENFLVNLLAEVVRHRTDKGTLREVGNLGCRNERIKLGIDRRRYVLTVDGNGLPLLEHLAEALGKRLCRFSHHLAAENVAYRILDDLGLFFTIVPVKLTEILKAQQDSHLVASGGGYQVIQPAEVDGGKLVDDDRTLQLTLLVDELDDAGIVQPQGCGIDVLAVRVVAHTENLGFLRIVDIQ